MGTFYDRPLSAKLERVRRLLQGRCEEGGQHVIRTRNFIVQIAVRIRSL